MDLDFSACFGLPPIVSELGGSLLGPANADEELGLGVVGDDSAGLDLMTSEYSFLILFFLLTPAFILATQALAEVLDIVLDESIEDMEK